MADERNANLTDDEWNQLGQMNRQSEDRRDAGVRGAEALRLRAEDARQVLANRKGGKR